MATVDKRRRNARRSKYRPRTEAQKQRRKELWTAREADRKAGRRLSEEDALTLRLEELEAALRDQGHVGIHNRRHVTPLDEIDDDVQRFAVLKARVERLEALWAINQRKRETRGKIIIGGALLAEAADFEVEDRDELMERLVDILDRRVDRVRDRLTVRELLGNPPLALRPGGDLEEDAETALAAAGEQLPDFDAMARSALAESEDEAAEWDGNDAAEAEMEEAHSDPS
ncbi:hypothetical protein GGQ61_003572 [Phenylobacterium haematophilum]|uniref:Uncharacterized protein n=1 Tax=Phenylobacterium haematophilum TaxID=98513 RepID=A0A840A3E2_9CAUL|nr:hypothetical protein [Phenylobacterium haematophilum]MBB3892834.1 hypothetical protein [Phenylobacterium haematophilum]